MYLLLGDFKRPCDGGNCFVPVLPDVYMVVACDGGEVPLKLSDTSEHGLVLLRAVLLRERCGYGIQPFLEAFAEAAVHRFLLQGLGGRVYLQVVVLAPGVYLLQPDGLLLVVMYDDRPPASTV